jgi:hypothetical protein
VDTGYLVNAGFTDKFGANTDTDNQVATAENVFFVADGRTK